MTDYEPQEADYDGVKLDNETYESLLEAAEENHSHNVSESADKIVLTTNVKRGTETRDEDKIRVKVKGDDPTDTVLKLGKVLDVMRVEEIPELLRETQPGDDE